MVEAGDLGERNDGGSLFRGVFPAINLLHGLDEDARVGWGQPEQRLIHLGDVADASDRLGQQPEEGESSGEGSSRAKGLGPQHQRVPGRGGGDNQLEGNNAAGVRDREVANRVLAEPGVIGRANHLGLVDISQVGIDLDEEVVAGERAGLAKLTAALALPGKRDPGGALEVGQGAPASRGAGHIAAMAELRRRFGVGRNNIRPPELAVAGFIADKSAKFPALWNVNYLHNGFQGGKPPGPACTRMVAAGDSRGNPADPMADVSTRAGCCRTPFRPKTPRPQGHCKRVAQGTEGGRLTRRTPNGCINACRPPKRVALSRAGNPLSANHDALYQILKRWCGL